MTIGIVMNVYDETDTLRKALKSIQNVGYDELHTCLSSDSRETEDICKEFGAVLHRVPDSCFYTNSAGNRRYSFGDGRNYARSVCKTDWTMYLDADDILVGGDRIRACLDENKGANVVKMNYQFSFADDEMTIPNCVVTIYRIAKKGKWVGRQHEHMVADEPMVFIPDAVVKHDHKFRREEKFKRNLEDCIEQYDEIRSHQNAQKLGMSYFDCGDYKNALIYLKRYLRADMPAGWRFRTLIKIGDAYFSIKEYEKAFNFYTQASEHCPDDGLWAFRIGGLYGHVGDYDKGVEYTCKGFSLKTPMNDTFPWNPEEYGYQPAMNLYKFTYESGRVLEAYMLLAGEIIPKWNRPRDKELQKRLWNQHSTHIAQAAAEKSLVNAMPQTD